MEPNIAMNDTLLFPARLYESISCGWFAPLMARDFSRRYRSAFDKATTRAQIGNRAVGVNIVSQLSHSASTSVNEFAIVRPRISAILPCGTQLVEDPTTVLALRAVAQSVR